MPAEAKAGPRGYHGSEQEAEDLKQGLQRERRNPLAGFFNGAFSFLTDLTGENKKRMPATETKAQPTTPPPPKKLPTSRPPLPFGPPAAPPPRITEEMKEIARRQDELTARFSREYQDVQDAYRELQNEVAELKDDTSVFSKEKQLERALCRQFIEKKDYLCWLAKLEEKRIALLAAVADADVETKLRLFLHDIEEVNRNIAALLEDNLPEAKQQLEKKHREDLAKFRKDIEQYSKTAEALNTALAAVQSPDPNYSIRYQALDALRKCGTAAAMLPPLDIEGRCKNFELEYGKQLKEKALLESHYETNCSAMRNAAVAFDKYQRTPGYSELLKNMARKKLLMFLKDDLFSDANIRNFWPRHTFRFLCRGGLFVDGAYVPTGIGKIKLFLKEVNLETLSDAETEKYYDRVFQAVHARLTEGRGRKDPTVACYAALGELQKKDISEDNVNVFIATMRSQADLRAYQVETQNKLNR